MPHILALPRAGLPGLPTEGCWAFTGWLDLPAPVWRKRSEIEQNENLLQLIPYVVLRNAAGELWTYARTGGDERLEGRCSCGVGGHVETIDAGSSLKETLIRTARREMAEELGLAPTSSPMLEPTALIYESHSAIGRVHLGVLFLAAWQHHPPPSPPPHESLRGLGFAAPAAIATDRRFEHWSRMAARFVSTME